MNKQISLFGVAYAVMCRLDAPLCDMVKREAKAHSKAPIFYVADLLEEHYTLSWRWLSSRARFEIAATIVIATIYDNHHLSN